jgi:hypothetical protein
VKSRLYMCCSNSETVIITVLEAVARKRLLIIQAGEDLQFAAVICKVWRLAVAL